jgi:hypothetical protein
MNHICCSCDIKVSSFTAKSGTQVQFQEHIINDFRIFSKPKGDAQPSASQQVAQAFRPAGAGQGGATFPGGDAFSNGSNSATCYSPAAQSAAAGEDFSSDALDLPY